MGEAAGRRDDDRVTAFDRQRAQLLALPAAIAHASPRRQEELCGIVVERVIVRDRRVETISWTPQARPFFEKQQECPQGDWRAHQPTDEALDYYTA